VANFDNFCALLVEYKINTTNLRKSLEVLLKGLLVIPTDHLFERNNMSTLNNVTENSNSLGKYSYNYTYLPPLAMLDTLPTSEDFSARPGWILLIARSVLEILINAIMIGINREQGIPQYMEKLLVSLKESTGELKADAKAALLKSIEGELKEQGFPTSPAKVEAFLKGVIETFAMSITKETLNDLIQIIMKLGVISGQASSLKDYDQLFQFIPLPKVSQNFQNDAEFAAMRVAGPNPVMIERLQVLDTRMGITEEQYKSVMGTQDSLQTALAQGRLYLADYSVFKGALNGSFPDAQKFNYAPLALFAVPLGKQALMPVAIQYTPQTNVNSVIFTPQDGYDWLIAKTLVQIADGNFHEAVSHLGRTHLFVEPFVMATHNQLSSKHPLSILLNPHFEGTLAINNAAQASLIASGGGVDKLLSSSIDQSRVFAIQGAQSYLLNVNTSTLPQTLAQRGVNDPSMLPDYPYRDDALLLWNAIEQWISHYVNYYYPSDNAVESDSELQNWVAELVAHDGGRINNIGQANSITKRAELAELVTLVCFTGSVQHAAVNFPQGDIMTYTPAMPLAGYTPATEKGATEADFLKLLPPLDKAQSQLELVYTLGSVYYTRLGDYGDNYFTDPKIQAYLHEFQQELSKIEAEIKERNKIRTPYEYLLPSRIPQSINI
jgi:arachidonate 15-lipoxygenase